MLHNGAQRVAVSCHHDGLASLKVWDDRVTPVGQGAFQHIFETLRTRNRLAGVTRIGVLAELGTELNLGRRHVIGPTPLHKQVLAVFVTDSLLVQALQGAVVPFVQPPRAAHRNPVPVARVQRQVSGHNRAAQQGSVQDIRQDAFLLK